MRSRTSPLRFPRRHREPFDPDPRLIRHCERLLADARSGKLRAVAYATVYHDDLSPAGSVDHGWAAAPGTYYATSHGVARLARAWGRECDGDSDDRELDRPPPTCA